MHDNRRRLHVVHGQNKGRIVENTTCFAIQAKFGVDCKRTKCKHWINHQESHNCVLIAAQQGSHTLQKIGQIYGLTRMRICQIEKGIFEKIRKFSR